MSRLRVLDAWRGLAALLVAMFHLQAIHPELVPGKPFSGCVAFVDFFFVLSGFVLARGYFGPGFDVAAFTWRRLARLVPLHVYTLFVIVLLEASKSLAQLTAGIGFKRAAFEGLGIAGFIDNLFLLQVTGMLGHKISWNTPAWSLSAELAANVLVGVLVAVLMRRFVLPVLALIVIGCFALLASHVMPVSDYGPPALVRCLYAFGVGCLLFRLYERWPIALSLWAWSLLEVLAVSAMLVVAALLPVANWYLATLLFGFAVLVFAHERGAISDLMRRFRLEFLGTISYSIYLNHIAVLLVSEKALGVLIARAASPSLSVSLAYCGLFLAAVIVYSWATYRCIEVPGQRRLLALRERGAGIAASGAPTMA